MNSSNLTFSHQPSTEAFLAWFVFTMLICVVGGMLYALLIFISLRDPQGRSGTGILLGHLFILEWTLCSIQYPILVIARLHSFFYHVQTLHCPSIAYIFYSTINAGYWSACLLSINRFVAILLPHAYEKWSSRKAVVSMTILAWIIGLTNNLPFLTGNHDWLPEQDCIPIPNENSRQIVVWATVGAYIPMLSKGVIYTTIVVNVKILARRNAVFPMSKQTQKANRARLRRFTLVKVLFSSYLWHILTYLPSPLIFSSFPEITSGHPYASYWMLTALICGYSANPIFFLSMNEDYRVGLKSFVSRVRGNGSLKNNSIDQMSDASRSRIRPIDSNNIPDVKL